MSEVPDIPQRDAQRVTPYELVFGATVFDEARFEEIRTEAGGSGAQDPSALFMLPAAGEVLRALSPAQGGPEAVAQVRALVYAAYRFWLSGRNVYRFPEAILPAVLGASAAPPVLPVPAGYVQLPRNLIWARVAAESAPEPADGFFWSVPESDPDGPLELLFALGLRPGRPGLSLFDVRLESAAHLEQWGAAKVREGGDDFANVLPGGELQGYLALTTAAEALKLAALCLARLGTGQWNAEQQSDGQRIHEPADG